MKSIVKIRDLHQDRLNFNDGTFEGNVLLEKSLRDLKCGRSILLDKNKNIIAGNKTAKIGEKLGVKAKIVESDGTEIIAVRRTDIELDSKKGRELALADNVTSEKNLSWNADNVKKVSDTFDGFDIESFGVDLSFNEHKIENFGEVDVTGFDINQTLRLSFKTADYIKVVEKLRLVDDDLKVALLKILGYGE